MSSGLSRQPLSVVSDLLFQQDLNSQIGTLILSTSLKTVKGHSHKTSPMSNFYIGAASFEFLQGFGDIRFLSISLAY